MERDRQKDKMLIGYARTSTEDHNLDLQMQALSDACCDRIYSDKKINKAKVQKGLDEALGHLRSGDTLVVWRLDRLNKTIKQLIDFVTELDEQDIQFRSLNDNIDTTSGAGRFFYDLMVSLAQMEKELISESAKAGQAASKRPGRVAGRWRIMTEGKIKSAKKLLKTGMVPQQVAAELGVSLATLYRWIPSAANLQAED